MTDRHAHPLPWVFDDGGRQAAGYRGDAGDCVCRSIAIATRLPYQDVYDTLNAVAQEEQPRGSGKRSSARTGVQTPTVRRFLDGLGWQWTPTMGIGTGCTVHLAAGELPGGRLIVRVSRHITAVIDGVVHDIDDPGRDGTRCVYGTAKRFLTAAVLATLPVLGWFANDMTHTPAVATPAPASSYDRFPCTEEEAYGYFVRGQLTCVHIDRVEEYANR